MKAKEEKNEEKKRENGKLESENVFLQGCLPCSPVAARFSILPRERRLVDAWRNQFQL